MTPPQKQLLDTLNLIVDAARKAMENGQTVDLDVRAGMVCTEPVDNCVTRKATGEKLYQIFIGPKPFNSECAS